MLHLRRTGAADFPRHLSALIEGPAKAGKGLANGTPVLTPDGWAAIDMLEPGDKIRGLADWTIVTGVFPQGERDLYRVTTDDGGRVVCDDQHLWTVMPGGTPRTLGMLELQERLSRDPVFGQLPTPVPLPGTELLPLRRIAEIQPAGRGESTCIKVDAPDGLFVTQDWIVTHNTTLLGTVPNILIADVEAGLMSIAHLDVPYITIDSSATLKTLLTVLEQPALRRKTAEDLGMDAIEAVGIDTADALQQMLIKERLRQERRTQLQREDWGWLLDQMREIIRAFVALPMHVLLTVHTKTQQDDEGRIIHIPGLQGAIAEEIAGLVGFSFFAQRIQEVDPESGYKRTYYRLLTEGDERRPHVGNRAAGRLPAVVEPDWKSIVSAVYDGLELPETQERQVDFSTDPAVVAAVRSRQGPHGEKVAQNPGHPADDSEQPLTDAAREHLRKAYGSFQFLFPEKASRGWTLGWGRSVLRVLKAAAEEIRVGGADPKAARAQLESDLRRMGAFTDTEEERVVAPRRHGSIPEVMAWVGDSLDRLEDALADEKAETKPRVTLLERLNTHRKALLERQGQGEARDPAVGPPAQDEAEPEGKVEPTSSPADDSTTAATALLSQELNATVVDGGEPGSEEVPQTSPQEGAGGQEAEEVDPYAPLRLRDVTTLEQAPPCQIGDPHPVDDLEIAKLAHARWKRWVCMQHFKAAQTAV